MATIVLGAQFGDEGKGKLVDILCKTADVCARSAGGTNAGHTVVANGVTHDFHMLPSGLVHPHCVNLIGSGVVVHAPSFFAELETAEKNGLSVAGRVFVSDRAHLVFDFHQLVDGLGEVELGAASIGTTRKGIGPTYAAKASRSGIRIAEIFDWTEFERKYRSLLRSYEKRFSGFQYDVEEELGRYKVYRERFRPYLTDAVLFMSKALKENKHVVVEGANALLLDIDYGTYPFVTSSSTSIGGTIAGLALSPFKIKEIIGVVKAYTTRVGSGPFPTELSGDICERIQTVGGEIGVTTKRKRRCGWLDLVIVRYSAAVNNYTSVNLTKLDVLNEFSEVKVAVGYKVDGQLLPTFPADTSLLSRVEPEYKVFPGWSSSTTKCTSYDQLPREARDYVEFIEDFIGVRIDSIGIGPDREDLLRR
ncbi:MAG: hypothetical protein M1813_009553 [Trichoglossum hirsutum]|nr:MAG: hypothetical protein M1813_009553 [Trichoglossum hirsutum]